MAGALIEGMDAEHLLADRGYDSDAIVAQAMAQGMQAQTRHARIARYSETMTSPCIDYAILLKTLFCT
jgi:hypothetical protein